MIKTIANFPAQGVFFRDMSPLLADADAFRTANLKLVELFDDMKVDVLGAFEARGFTIAAVMAHNMHIGIVSIRKGDGLIPGETLQASYSTEYDKIKVVKIGKGHIKRGQHVVLVDDLLATGGTMLAGIDLVHQAGGVVVGVACLMGLDGLGGAERIQAVVPHARIVTLWNYPAHSDGPASQHPVVLQALVPIFFEHAVEPVQPAAQTQVTRVVSKLPTAPPIKYYVASTNEHKLRAVAYLFPTVELYKLNDLPSGVSEQPFGRAETETGAINRVRKAMECVNLQHDDAIVSIENGIELVDGVYRDFAVAVLWTEYVTLVGVSEPIPIPAEYNKYVKEALAQKVTFGSVIERVAGLPPGTWHAHIGKRSRTEQIVDALRCLEKPMHSGVA